MCDDGFGQMEADVLAGSWDTSLPCFMTMSTELGLYKFEMSTYVYTVFKAPSFFSLLIQRASKALYNSCM